MKNRSKQIAALMMAFLLGCGMTACGEDSSTGILESSQQSSAEKQDESTQTEPISSDTESSEASDDKSSSKDESSKSKKPEKDSSSKEESSKADDSSKVEAPESSQTGQEQPAGNDSKPEGGNTGSGGNQQPAEQPNGNTGEDEDDPDAGKPTKYIYLKGDTVQYDGEGMELAGNQLRIGKGGTYEISGTWNNGQIYIMTDKKKVKLHLNNASITNNAGSAINCQNAKKLTINALAGTVNNLTDGGNHDADKGTIFSEDTVVIKGEGTLNITAKYAHGIQSDDDIVIDGSTLNITSTKSCLHSNDGITINGGVIYCDGGTNGIKTDGFVTITGGSSVFLGGTREEKGAIYCDGAFTVTGGRFWAIGNTCTTPDASTTTANVIGMMFPHAQAGGTIVNVTSGANNIFTMTSPRGFKYVVYTGPDLLANAEYNVSYGGSVEGGSQEKYVWNGGSYSDGTSGGSFKAGNAVTFYTIG